MTRDDFQRFVDTPSTRDARVERADVDVTSLTPIGEGSRFVTNCDQAVRPSVSLLRLSCRPTTVVGLVTLFVVHALQGMYSTRTVSHVGQEVFEVQPALADQDTAPAVVVKARMSRVATALQHRVPDIVLGSATAAVLHSQFFAQTTTRLAGSPNEAAAINYFFTSTVTAAEPRSVAPVKRAIALNGYPSAKATPSKIFELHAWNINEAPFPIKEKS